MIERIILTYHTANCDEQVRKQGTYENDKEYQIINNIIIISKAVSDKRQATSNSKAFNQSFKQHPDTVSRILTIKKR